MSSPFSDTVPSATASWQSGGTAHLLPEERKKATFDVQELRVLLAGGQRNLDKDREMQAVISNNAVFDQSDKHFEDRETHMNRSVQRSVAAHKHMMKRLQKSGTSDMDAAKDDISKMSGYANDNTPFGLHYAAWLPTIMGQADKEQQAVWLPKSLMLHVIGSYAQTELGHGSNVRALETTATYDKTNEEFIIHSPKLTSIKWWPGCMGKVCTHTVVYARLVLNGKDYGTHAFIVQMRDEQHKLLPGIEAGDIGPKIGYNAVDNGYCRFDRVRIPRRNMLMKYQQVTKDGEYVKPAKGKSKMSYGTMISIRSMLVRGAGDAISKGVTIAVRYSAVRHQGFANTKLGNTLSGEKAILDYQMQQYRLFKQLAVTYAMIFTGKWMMGKYLGMIKSLESGDVSDLPEVHASSAGLKAFCTFDAAEGLEDCRKACGGHGVTTLSGLPTLVNEYVPICTAEGEMVILALQTARHLVKSLRQGRAAGGGVVGHCRYLVPACAPGYDVMSESCPATSVSQLLQLDVLCEAWAWRCRKQVLDVEAQLSQRAAQGDNFDTAWNACAMRLYRAARVHCDYVMLRNFADAVDRVEDGATKQVLADLCRLYAVCRMKEECGDWMGYMGCAQADLVQQAVAQLLARVRPNAVALVDAFGHPDFVLGSCLGREDGNVYEAMWDYVRRNPLNRTEVFSGYEHIESVLDKKFLSHGAAAQRKAYQAKQSML